MKFSENQKVKEKFASYPEFVQDKMYTLRNLLIETARELDDVEELEETLKWGEPSYITKHGSTIRMDWKASSPDQYAMYFHCQTRLVETFRELYPDTFTFDGNRAVLFSCMDDVAVDELKHCISIALNYHKVKHLPLLGA